MQRNEDIFHHQCAYQEGKSTHTAICKLKELKPADTIFFDFSDAFNTVKWTAILEMLGTLLEEKEKLVIPYIKDYLTGTGYGYYDGTDLIVYKPTSGSAQGSRLSPLLFILTTSYAIWKSDQGTTNGLKIASRIQSYSDDSAIYRLTTDESEVFMDMVNRYCRIITAIGIKISEKTNCMYRVPGNQKELVKYLNTETEVDILKTKEDGYTYLGVVVDKFWNVTDSY